MLACMFLHRQRMALRLMGMRCRGWRWRRACQAWRCDEAPPSLERRVGKNLAFVNALDLHIGNGASGEKVPSE